MLVPLRGWFFAVIVIAITAGGYYQVFEQFPLPSSEDERVRTLLAERWAQKVASEVKRLPGRPVVAVARVVNDDDGILTAQLKKWIARRNVLMVNDQWYNGVGYKAGLTNEPSSIDESCKSLIGMDVDYIVAAEIANWTTYPEFEATLVGHVEIRDGQSGCTVLQYQLSMPEMIEVVRTNSAVSDVAVVAASDAEQASSVLPPLTRIDPPSQLAVDSGATGGRIAAAPTVLTGLSVWLAMTIAFPLTSSKLLKKLLRHRSNQLNALLLFSWILTTSILAGLLWLQLLPLAMAVPMGAVAAVVAALYFGYCCHCLEKTL